MKKMAVFLMLSSAVATVPAEEFDVEAPVTAAVLYHNLAEVTRHAELTVPSAGRHRIVVPQLLAQNAGAIRPSVRGATLRGISSVPNWGKVDSPEQQQRQKLEWQLEVNAQEIAANKAMMQGLAKRLSRDGEFARVQSHLHVLQQNYGTLLHKRAAWQRELRVVQERLAWQKADDTSTQEIVFEVEVPTSGTVSLTWQANTDKAHWQPSSNWSLNSHNGHLSIEAHAEITQTTGLDWSNTELVLAIVPAEYVPLPPLAPQVVHTASAESTTEAMPLPLMAASAESMLMAKNTAPLIEASGSDFRVTLSGKYDLPSNQSVHNVTYWQGMAEAQVYSTVYDWTWPQDKALLLANWTMPNTLNILPGEMTLYRDGNFVTRMYHMDLMTTGSEQTLSFGIDSQLSVTIHHPPGYTEHRGLLKKSHALSQRTLIDVINHGNHEKKVKIYSRLPVSTEESVSVTPIWSPQPSEKNSKEINGLTLWQTLLAPQKSWQVESGFDIEYPEGKQLIGL